MTDDRRLWIGNIDLRINEFTILKLLQKYGSLKKFDFLYNTAGIDKGKPRGYCFVTYDSAKDALKAMKSLNGKLALGKTLHVKWAHEENKAERDTCSRNPIEKCPLKTDSSSEMKIRAIEEKLKEMESTNKEFSVSAKPTLPPGTSRLSHIHRETTSKNFRPPYRKHRR